MNTSGIITLLTDFGTREPFVGVMKGVIATLSPSARCIDLGHDLSPHDVRAAGFWLARAAPWFPPGTTHLCVVDPGVGGVRRALVAQADAQRYVAPDNGVLSEVLDVSTARVWAATVPDGASKTFHGRDVFAPLAAELGGGARPEDLGTPVRDWVRLERPALRREAKAVQGEVVVVDRFGNLISNVRPPAGRTTSGWVRVAAFEGDAEALRVPLVDSYEAGGDGPLALVNAWGVIEIAAYRDSAARRLGFDVGALVSLELT